MTMNTKHTYPTHSPPRSARPTELAAPKYLAKVLAVPHHDAVPSKYRQYTVLQALKLPAIHAHV